jgi:hypothetical protein
MAQEHLHWAFDEEERAAQLGRIQLIGRRFVCQAAWFLPRGSISET